MSDPTPDQTRPSEKLRQPHAGEPSTSPTAHRHEETEQEHEEAKLTAEDRHGHPHVGHVMPMWLLFSVFGALMVLTGLTVGVTSVDFGYQANLIVALVIAAVKAVLVVLFFMHLLYDSPFNGLVLITSLVFVTLFIGFVLLDAEHYEENLDVPQGVNIPAQQ